MQLSRELLNVLPKILLEPGFPDNSAGKESTHNAGDPSQIPGLGRSPGEGIGYPFQYALASVMAQLVKSLPAMQETWVRTLGGTIPWKRERLLIPVFCLENSMDYTGHGVTKSQTRLSDFHSHAIVGTNNYNIHS